MAPSFPQFNPMRLRSYIFRLPLCTRVLAAVILGLWIATIPFPWLREFGRLEPAKMDFTQSTWIFCWAGEEGCLKGLGWCLAHTFQCRGVLSLRLTKLFARL